MGNWLLLGIALQFACAASAARLDRPTFWFPLVLFLPLLGSLAYCGYEIMRGRAPVRPIRPAAEHGAAEPTPTGLGRLGYQAVRARTVDGRRALAEECMRLGRHADASLLFKSCMVGRHADDPRLVAGLKQATAQMKSTSRSAGMVGAGGTSIAHQILPH